MLLEFFVMTFTVFLKLSPFVNRGSGSFRKKDFSKLLMTLRSRHFCREAKGQESIMLKQSLQFKSVTANDVVSEGAQCTVQPNCQSLTSSWMSMSVMPLLLSSSCMLEMEALFPGTLYIPVYSRPLSSTTLQHTSTIRGTNCTTHNRKTIVITDYFEYKQPTNCLDEHRCDLHVGMSNMSPTGSHSELP